MPDTDMPIPASKSPSGPFIFIAGVVGTVLFCAAHAFYSFPTKLGEIEPNWALTPLYILPILIALLITKRIGILGLIFLTLAVTGAHYLAQTLGIMTLSLFTTNKSDSEILPFVVVGAVAGAVGSAVSFIAIALLGRNLRDATHLKLYVFSTFGLSATGALAFLSMTLLEPESNKWIFNLYLPWQLAFTLALARIFSTRAA